MTYVASTKQQSECVIYNNHPTFQFLVSGPTAIRIFISSGTQLLPRWPPFAGLPPRLPGSRGLLTSYYLWSFPPTTKLHGKHVTRGGGRAGAGGRRLAILNPHFLLDEGNLFHLLKQHKK